MSKLKVSIIIPTYNRREDLNKCVKSILCQTFKDYEIIIIDNNSSDGSQCFISDKYPFIKLIVNKQNKGPAFAKNQGILMSKGKYLWFLDSDSIVIDKDCLKNMHSILENNPDIGGIGGEIYTANSSMKINKLSFSGHSRCLSTTKDVNLLDVDYIATCNCFVKKPLMVSIGGFDPNFFFMCEDTDASLKIKEKGYRIVIDKKTSVFHKISMKGRSGGLFSYNKNRVRLMLLHLKFKHILFLPFYEVIDLFDKKKYQKIKKNDIDITKRLGSRLQTFLKNKNYLARLAVISLYYFTGLVCAYFYNLIILSQTFYIRFKKPSFLE